MTDPEAVSKRNVPATARTLAEWLIHIEQVHPRSIEMGLDRVHLVRERLALKPAFPLIVVGGTNGKGSACAMLETILDAGGYRVGCYTSPHLLRYNERVRLRRAEAGDEKLAAALAAVEAARGPVQLTYFEFSTLAAVWLFVQEEVDVAILEVGLGGRLDAVNAFDADCALIMSIDIDHVDYLGATREAIGREKAGILRGGRPAVCADPNPPVSLAHHAASLVTPLLVRERDFGYSAEQRQWRYWGPHGKRHGLPHPALRGESQLANASACIAALDCLRDRLPVSMSDIRTGLVAVENPGRFQVLAGRPLVVLDVAHNPEAARALARNLAALPAGGRTLAVFGMLNDKDIASVARTVAGRIDHWYLSGLDVARGADAGYLADRVTEAGVERQNTTRCANVAEAYAEACRVAAVNDKIIVFGSFHTVAAVIAARNLNAGPPAGG